MVPIPASATNGIGGDVEWGELMRHCACLVALALLVGCGANEPCNATTCPTGCCDGASCRTELTNQTCSTGGAACVACNTAAQSCSPASQSCAPFVIVRVTYTLDTTTGCADGGPCQAEARVWASDYPGLAADPHWETCNKVLVQGATATRPAVHAWNGCSGYGKCGATPWNAADIACRFVVPNSW